MNKNIIASAIFINASLLTACVSLPPTISTEVADAERQALNKQFLQEKANAQDIKKEKKYKQPINKKEKCLLAEADEYLAEGIKVYWDGDCVNGYASGLGREIAVGDYMHRETVYNPADTEEIFGVFRDYITNVTVYSKHTETDQSSEGARVTIKDESNFDIITELLHATPHELWGRNSFLANPFVQSFYYSNNFYTYLTQKSNDPTSQIVKTCETKETKTGKNIGVSFGQLANGRSVFLFNNQEVTVKPDYNQDYNVQLAKEDEYSRQASMNAGKAQDLYKKYLYKACKNSVNTNGIPQNLYKEICSYDAKFNEKIQMTVQHNEQVYAQKQNAIENERLIRAREAEAIAAQQQAAAAQEQANAARQQVLQNSLPKYTQCFSMGGMTNCSTR